MAEINLYCDESGHLERDQVPVMVLGAVSCPTRSAPRIARDLRGIKQINTAPFQKGKEEGFWHLITEEEDVQQETGGPARERIPNFRRCERIGWPGAILREGEGERVVAWRERRPDGLRLVHALPDFSYLVALAIRREGKLYLATAFPVDLEWRRSRLRKQYERYLKAGEP